MRINYPSYVVVRLMFFFISVFFGSSSFGVEKEDLDVNLNAIYVSAKSHRNNNVQGELVVQIPVALTKKADETGLGPIGSIVYFDNKSLMQIRKTNSAKIVETERATVRGLGRLYYVVSAYDTTHTFIPYLTFYRELLMEFTDAKGKQTWSKAKAFLPPGFEYAYRMDDKVVLHFDTELYSYSKLGNNSTRGGASYALSEKWLVSASYERLAWDIKDEVNKGVLMNGTSNSVYLKLINSNPLRNNFAFTLGYAADRDTLGDGLQPIDIKRSNGLFWGAEFSFGTLAW